MSIDDRHYRQADAVLDFWNHGPQELARSSLALSLKEAESRGWFAGAKAACLVIVTVNATWALAWWLLSR